MASRDEPDPTGAAAAISAAVNRAGSKLSRSSVRAAALPNHSSSGVR